MVLIHKKVSILCFLICYLISLPSSLAFENLYVESKSQEWNIRPLINVGTADRNNQYRLVGIPDGLGVHKKNNSEINIYMNHEIANDKGIARSHGGKGAFVSQWVLDLNSLKITSGDDLIKKVMIWNRDKKYLNYLLMKILIACVLQTYLKNRLSLTQKIKKDLMVGYL